jgi:tetratricopeptide (TPR) repeat protein
VLADVDQSLAFGFVDEAKEALRNVGRRHPGHPAILEKIELLGLDQVAETGVEETPFDLGSLGLPSPSVPGPLDLLGDAPSQPVAPRRTAPSAPARRAAAPASEPFDLGAELDDLFGAQPAVEGPASGTPATELGDPSLVRIFEEFKKGVDQQLGKEDYDTRYNLGIAYKEMGLVDEAISEFQLAAKDDSRMLECASMLGLCFMEKGMPKLAVKWFEKGLATPGRLEEEYHGLRYDLALAHESAGETDAALRVFMELYSLDASFRDVATRVRDLRASLGR